MKRTLKITGISILALILFLLAYFKWAPYEKIDPFQIIPADAVYILESDKPIEHWKAFSKSDFWTFLKKYPALQELTEDADYLDSLISANNKALNTFGDRQFILSAHMTKARDYDFLFAFDLRRSSKLDLELVLETMLDDDEFKVSSQTYRDTKVVEVTDVAEGDVLYLCKIENYLACTYAQTIVHDVVDLINNNDLKQDEHFQEVYTRVEHDGLGQFYLNYKYLDQFLSVYLQDDYHLLSDITSQFSFTAVDLELEGDHVQMDGYTSIPFERKDYAHLIQHNGSNKPTYQNVLSARCAYVQSMHINNAVRFYNELLELRKMEGDDVASYKKLQLRVEKTLKLNLEEDFLSWFGNEVFVAQNMPYKHVAKEEDIVFGIKLRDKDKAFEKLAKIQKQIKKRTPATFKQLSYKGNTIHYLDLKSMFNLFFGKKFQKLTKPYYTVIDDFILFSNSPKTLVALLEDYENKDVLAHNFYFNEVKDNMPTKMSLFTYVNAPLYYETISRELRADEGNGFKQHKAYFKFFNCAGIAYTAYDHGFKNGIYLKYDKELGEAPFPAYLALDSLYNTYVVQSGFPLDDAGKYVTDRLNKGVYTLYYPDGQNIKIKASVKNNQLHGKFEEYYLNGKLRSKGRYRKGRKIGLWTYYSPTGKVEERKWGD